LLNILQQSGAGFIQTQFVIQDGRFKQISLKIAAPETLSRRQNLVLQHGTEGGKQRQTTW
jgi:hypothetical protein